MRGHSSWSLVTENNSYGEMETVKLGAGWQGDGIILYRASEKELRYFREKGMAVVLLSSEGLDLGYPRVLPDNAKIGEVAALHLLGQGHRNFSYLARGETLYDCEEYAPGQRRYSRERLAGFKRVLKNSSYQPLVHMMPGFRLWEHDAWKKIEDEVAQFLATLPKPIGLFAVDDALAAVVLKVAARIGLNVPSELSVLGYGDDLKYCHATFPALTSIAHPARKCGYLAAQMLDRQLQGECLDGKVIRVPPSDLHERESTDFIAIADLETAKLVQWVRQNAPHKALQVSDLADQSSYSLSSIKTKFKKYLGHSPKEEIQLIRTAQLKHLLADPAIPLANIAASMQFPSVHEMGRFFLRQTGERSTAFRANSNKRSLNS